MQRDRDNQSRQSAPAELGSTTAARPRTTMSSNGEFLCVKQAAAFLNVSKSYLDKLRCHGGGPMFVRLGMRKILYRRADLESWARQLRYESTSQYPSSSGKFSP